MTKSTSRPELREDLPGDLHVVPLLDLISHIDSCTCICKPVLDEEDGRIWVHNAADSREQFELHPTGVLH